MTKAGPPDLRQPLASLDGLVDELEREADPAARERARGLVRALLEVHRLGLGRLLDLLGPEATERLAGDEAVGLLLSVHGLNPRPVEGRVRAAVEELGPRLSAEGVSLALDEVTDELVALTLRPAGPARVRASAAALRVAIEEAIGRAAPEIVSVAITGLDAPDVRQIRLGERSAP